MSIKDFIEKIIILILTFLISFVLSFIPVKASQIDEKTKTQIEETTEEFETSSESLPMSDDEIQALADAIVYAMNDTVDSDITWDSVVLELCQNIVSGISYNQNYLAYKTGNDYKLLIGDITYTYNDKIFTYTDCTIVTIHRYYEGTYTLDRVYYYDMSYDSGSGTVEWEDSYIYSSLEYFPRLTSVELLQKALFACIFAIIVFFIFVVVWVFFDFSFRARGKKFEKEKYL